MKKPFVLIAAIVAVVGFGTVAAVAKERIKVHTSVTLRHNANDPNPRGGDGTFSGRVKAKKGCQERRTVVLYDGGPGDRHGSDKSNDRGEYKIVPGPTTAGPTFYVEVGKKEITRNNGDRIVCKSAIAAVHARYIRGL